jgi:hypothetical protein
VRLILRCPKFPPEEFGYVLTPKSYFATTPPNLKTKLNGEPENGDNKDQNPKGRWIHINSPDRIAGKFLSLILTNAGLVAFVLYTEAFV